MIEETDGDCLAAKSHRIRGDVLVQYGDSRRAEESYTKALSVARRQGGKLWELHAAMGLARLWLEEGKRTEARDLLAPTYGWFTEGFDDPALGEAKALLDTLMA